MYPIKVSQNGRYFTDQAGEPVFWLGTTQWQLFREFRLDDARLILRKTADTGFAFSLVMLLGVGEGPDKNINGDLPWFDNDPLKPNEAYFKHVDAVIRAANDANVVLSIAVFHQRYRKYITVGNAREWARWISQRYKSVPSIVWSITPEAKDEFVPILQELAAGLREGDGGFHPITFKPDPSPYSSSFIHDTDWLDFNSMQVWNRMDLIYPMVTDDYNLKPVKPVVMAEGAYEAGTEYSFEVTPLWVRRQAYYSFLAGAHHAYGHNDSWRVLPTWKQALDAPGAAQLGLLKKTFMSLPEWWLMVPDQSLLATGGKTEGDYLNLSARHEGRKWALVYLSMWADFTVDTSKIGSGASVSVTWIDPRTAELRAIGKVDRAHAVAFSTPDKWEDALLLLTATD